MVEPLATRGTCEMSIYTTQLRWIVERLQHEHHSDPNDFTDCYEYLGLSDYPIFDETYRQTLNDKIIRHFYFREIGFETAAQFAFYVRNRMHEQMPYYNQLYLSVNLITDPITNRRLTWQETYQLAQGGGTSLTKSLSSSTTATREEDTLDNLTHGKIDTVVTEYGKVDTTETEYGRTETTETEYGKVDTSETEYVKTNTETTSYGKVDTTETEYGKVDTSETEYGKGNVNTVEHGRVDTETDTYGKTSTDTTTTTYGKTQATVNGGSDTNREGNTHERVIESDTPMNQISNSGVENLNYASKVTYTDREGISGNTTTYGGTTNITNGGSDSTSASGSTGGTDTKRVAITGTDTTRDTQSGSDTTTDTLSGSDTTTDTLSGSDTTSGSIGGSDTTTDTLSGSDTVSYESGGTDTKTDTQSGSDTTTGTASGTDSRAIDFGRRDSSSTTSTDTTGTTRDLDESGTRSHNVSGYEGTSPSELLMKWRDTFLNIDMQVIHSLDILFFGLWM